MLAMTLSIFETLLNRTLAFDARIDKHLRDLDGKVLQIHVRDLDLNFYVFFKIDGIRLQGGKREETEVNKTDVQVHAPIATLLSFVRSHNLKEAIEAGLVVEGDLTLALGIQGFVQNLDIDWEEILSRYTGDVIAHPVVRFFKSLRKKKTKLLESFFLSSGIFLQEELKCLPTKVEVEHFNQSLDNLHNQVERLEAKVNILDKNRVLRNSRVEILESEE